MYHCQLRTALRTDEKVQKCVKHASFNYAKYQRDEHGFRFFGFLLVRFKALWMAVDRC